MAEITLKPCKFTFDDGPTYDGFSHGSTWNGFDNVAVTKDTLEKIIKDFDDIDTAEEFNRIEPMDDGLYSLGWGFSTSIVEPDDFRDVLNELVRCDGACLYWQMGPRAKLALEAGAVKEAGDLLVHPAAIEIEKGMAYFMPPLMPILYLSDEAEPSLMSLRELIGNFRFTETEIHEQDLISDLQNHGWFLGLHDGGRFCVLNLDKLNLRVQP